VVTGKVGPGTQVTGKPTYRAGGVFAVAAESPESHSSLLEARICMFAVAETLGSMRTQNPNQYANRNPRRSNNGE
jgi:hypothetical protein